MCPVYHRFHIIRSAYSHPVQDLRPSVQIIGVDTDTQILHFRITAGFGTYHRNIHKKSFESRHHKALCLTRTEKQIRTSENYSRIGPTRESELL